MAYERIQEDKCWTRRKTQQFSHFVPYPRGFINMNQGKAEPKYAFKPCFDNVYETMELSGG